MKTNNFRIPTAESFAQSLKEMKLMRQGKMKERSLNDFFNKLEEEENGNYGNYEH